MADYDIFREQLGIRYPRYGHALWDPSPSNPNRPVEIGDVGFIRRGRFHRLFNALLSEYDTLQDHGVPEHYEQLKPSMEEHVSKSSLTYNDYHSTEVCVKGESEYYSSPNIRGISFSCCRQGAVLSLPVDAQRMDTLVQSDFSQWIVKHIDSCFAFSRRLGLGIEQMEEIVLVTGCDRARSWINVAFLGGASDAQASFGIKITGDTDTGINIQYRRGYVTGALLNQGPEGENLPYNQCVFIRGFRVARAFKLFPKRLQAAAGPSEGPKGYDGEPDNEVMSVPTATKYRDPLYVLLDYITEARDCDMVLVHDDDLERVHGTGADTSLKSLKPEVLLDLLRRSNMTIHKVCCDLSSVGNSPKTDTGVVRVAMLSMLYHNWNFVLPSQPLPDMVQDLGPPAYYGSESRPPLSLIPPSNSPSLRRSSPPQRSSIGDPEIFYVPPSPRQTMLQSTVGLYQQERQHTYKYEYSDSHHAHLMASPLAGDSMYLRPEVQPYPGLSSAYTDMNALAPLCRYPMCQDYAFIDPRADELRGWCSDAHMRAAVQNGVVKACKQCRVWPRRDGSHYCGGDVCRYHPPE